MKASEMQSRPLGNVLVELCASSLLIFISPYLGINEAFPKRYILVLSFLFFTLFCSNLYFSGQGMDYFYS